MTIHTLGSCDGCLGSGKCWVCLGAGAVEDRTGSDECVACHGSGVCPLCSVPVRSSAEA